MSEKRCFERQLLIVAPFMCLLAASAMAQIPVGANVSYAVHPFLGSGLTLNEPVFLVFSLDNRSPEAVSVDLGKDCYGGFRAKLTRPDGSAVDRLRPDDRDGVSVPCVESVAPLGKYAKTLLLNKWFVFDSPGRYALDVELTGPILVNGVAESHPVAGHVEIAVGGPNPARLAGLCEELRRRVPLVGPGGRDAAEALSYVNDPVAVPFLKAMLGGGYYQNFAIEGLARVGDSAAVEVLISQTGHPDLPTRTFVYGSLARIAGRTQDEALKQRIRDVLAQSPPNALSISPEGKRGR